MALYNCVSTTKWTGRQELRSWVAGLQVSQDSALYCSKTNLRRETHRDIRLGSLTPFLRVSSGRFTSTHLWCLLETVPWGLPGSTDSGGAGEVRNSLRTRREEAQMFSFSVFELEPSYLNEPSPGRSRDRGVREQLEGTSAFKALSLQHL